MKDIELWRRDYTKEAYIDQAGVPQWGYVVYEQIIVHDTGERQDINDGYSIHKDHAAIWRDDTGRRFKVWTETVDYTGGTHVKRLYEDPSEIGYWYRFYGYNRGHVYPDGTGPVLPILDENKSQMEKVEERKRRELEKIEQEEKKELARLLLKYGNKDLTS